MGFSIEKYAMFIRERQIVQVIELLNQGRLRTLAV